MKKYGYVRVSSKDQNPDRQMAALEKFGLRKKDVFLDQFSGKDFQRPGYHRMIKKLKEGDLLVIKSIDRLGRNYGEILEQWRKITKEIGANICVIDMPLLNTSNLPGDLTGAFISDLVLQILAYVAETERTFIKQRQAEGIAVAKQKGVKFGRRQLEEPEGFWECARLWEKGEISTREGARRLQMSHSTFYRRCRKHLEEQEKCNKM